MKAESILASLTLIRERYKAVVLDVGRVRANDRTIFVVLLRVVSESPALFQCQQAVHN